MYYDYLFIYLFIQIKNCIILLTHIFIVLTCKKQFWQILFLIVQSNSTMSSLLSQPTTSKQSTKKRGVNHYFVIAPQSKVRLIMIPPIIGCSSLNPI